MSKYNVPYKYPVDKFILYYYKNWKDDEFDELMIKKEINDSDLINALYYRYRDNNMSISRFEKSFDFYFKEEIMDLIEVKEKKKKMLIDIKLRELTRIFLDTFGEENSYYFHFFLISGKILSNFDKEIFNSIDDLNLKKDYFLSIIKEPSLFSFNLIGKYTIDNIYKNIMMTPKNKCRKYLYNSFKIEEYVYAMNCIFKVLFKTKIQFEVNKTYKYRNHKGTIFTFESNQDVKIEFRNDIGCEYKYILNRILIQALDKQHKNNILLV